MSTSPHLTTLNRCFARDYEVGRSAAMRDLERSVLGCDYGGTSWTTRREAGRIAELLELRPGVRLLDVGPARDGPVCISRSLPAAMWFCPTCLSSVFK